MNKHSNSKTLWTNSVVFHFAHNVIIHDSSAEMCQRFVSFDNDLGSPIIECAIAWLRLWYCSGKTLFTMTCEDFARQSIKAPSWIKLTPYSFPQATASASPPSQRDTCWAVLFGELSRKTRRLSLWRITTIRKSAILVVPTLSTVCAPLSWSLMPCGEHLLSSWAVDVWMSQHLV